MYFNAYDIYVNRREYASVPERGLTKAPDSKLFKDFKHQ